METNGLATTNPAGTTQTPSHSGRAGWLLLPFASLWARRTLFRRVLRRDIEASFRGSALGVLWMVLIPLVMVAVYTFIFSVVMQSAWADQGAEPGLVPLIYFSGIVVFGFFSEVLSRAPNHIRGHATYVKKVIFPLDLLDWVLVGSAAVRMGVGLVLLSVALALFGQRVPVEVLWLPLLYLPYAVLMLGIAWFLSAIGTYVRDLGHIITAVAPVLMFISPVFYSLEQVPEAARLFYLVNPLTFVLESARQILFFHGGFPWAGYAAYWLAALVVFYAGYFFFQRARPGFADVV